MGTVNGHIFKKNKTNYKLKKRKESTYYEALHVFFHIALSVFIEEDSMGCSQIQRVRLGILLKYSAPDKAEGDLLF